MGMTPSHPGTFIRVEVIGEFGLNVTRRRGFSECAGRRSRTC